MITVMIITDSIKSNEFIAGSVIGGFENSICVISTPDVFESERIIKSQAYDIDLFFVQVKMKKLGGNKIAETIRSCKKYRNTPILFITPINHNTVGFSELVTYHGYKKQNYISTPIQRIDIQGKVGLYLDKIIEEASAKSKHERVIFIEHSNGESFIEVKNILFAEVYNKNLTIYTKRGSYSVKRMSLDNIIKQVDDLYLVRCHKSFAINVNEVVELIPAQRRNWTAVLKSGIQCPVSQTFYDTIKSRLIEVMTR